jgi:hypothetical protein
MIPDKTLQRITGILCIASVIVYPLLILKIVDFSMLIIFPMHAGTIFTGFILSWRPCSPTVRWNGSVPKILQFILPLVFLFGLINIVYSFYEFSKLMQNSPDGEQVHHLNAYFEQGKCVAVFNRSEPVEMSSEFCDDFNLHFMSAFCGGWMLFATMLNWISWVRRRDSSV